jgi:hypothetical protein
MAKIALNPAIPWELEFRTAISNLDAELRTLNVGAIDLADVNGAHFLLPNPNRIGYLYCSGNVHGLTILRPQGVALRLHISGQSRQIWLDGKSTAFYEGNYRWQSDNALNNNQCYEVEIAGNVSELCIGYHHAMKQSGCLMR